MNNYVAMVLEYAKRIASENLLGANDCISIKAHNGFMYITKLGVDFSALTENDVVKVERASVTDKEYLLHASIYEQNEETNAVCHVHPRWVVPVSKAGRTIPAVLDDMTQIVGPTCKTVKDENPAILKALTKANSCLIKDDGCITTGRSMDEAYTCVLVLDKASHCYVASAVIGKNVVINKFEALLMNFIYKKKYSKANQQNLQVKEEE